jgi:hypothetical protein
MTSALHLTDQDELPAPRVDLDSATVLEEAIETLSQLRTPTGSATPESDGTLPPASSPKPNSCFPRSSNTPATKNSPGPTSANCSASTQRPRSAATSNHTCDQLDEDHPHIESSVRTQGPSTSRVQVGRFCWRSR